MSDKKFVTNHRFATLSAYSYMQLAPSSTQPHLTNERRVFKTNGVKIGCGAPLVGDDFTLERASPLHQHGEGAKLLLLKVKMCQRRCARAIEALSKPL